MKFRSEALWGEGYREAASVMAHETFELQNTDILHTLRTTILKESEMQVKLEILEEELNNDTIADGDDGSLYNIIDNYQNDKELGCQFFRDVLQGIKNVTGKDIKYCLWLCDTIEDVYEYDIHNELKREDIDAYEESDIILSNIGSEGYLYGYEGEPRPIEPVTFRMYAGIRFNRKIDKDKDFISTGGYEFTMDGRTIQFDFEEYCGCIDKEHGDILEIDCENPDYDTFSDLRFVTEKALRNVSEVNEFTVYTGEPGESDLKPVELVYCSFTLPYEDFKEIKILDNVVSRAKFS